MNIFYLDKDPYAVPSYMSNKHVVKMIVESAQMLSTTIRVVEGEKKTIIKNGRKNTVYVHPVLDDVLYKAVSVNHPCTIWVRSNQKHFNWLLNHFKALCKEYTNRYNKVHLTQRKLLNIFYCPNNIPNISFFDPPLAMPDEYKTKDCIESYRIYYEKEKLFTQQDKERFQEKIKTVA